MILDALTAEADALRNAFLGLDDASYDRPTGCEPWTVKDLLAHVLVASRRIPVMLAGPTPPRAEVSALEYFHGDKLGGDFDRERVEAAQRDARWFASGHQIVDAIVDAVQESVRLVRTEQEDRLVFTRWGEAMVLLEYVETRVFELAVHGLDLANALGRAPWMTEAAARVTADVLLEGGDASPPEDTVAFIARATGRVPVAETELSENLLWPRRDF